MSKEQQRPTTPEQLSERKVRLEKIIKQRKALYDAVGTGKIQPGGEDWRSDLRVGKVKSEINEHNKKLRVRLEGVETNISDLQKQADEAQISRASEYLDLVALRRGQLKVMEEYVKKGHLPESILETRAGELNRLTSKEKEDEELRRGMQLLEERKKNDTAQPFAQEATVIISLPKEGKVPQEMEKALPRIKVNTETQEVEIEEDGHIRRKKIKNEYQYSVLLILARNKGEDVDSVILKKLSEELGITSEKPVRDAVKALRQFLGNGGEHTGIITSTKTYHNSKYRLNADVEIVEAETQLKGIGKKGREGIAMSATVTLPDGFKRVVKGAKQIAYLQKLIDNYGKDQITVDELSKYLLGASNADNNSTVSAMRANIRKKLRSGNWDIMIGAAEEEEEGKKVVKKTHYLEELRKEEESLEDEKPKLSDSPEARSGLEPLPEALLRPSETENLPVNEKEIFFSLPVIFDKDIIHQPDSAEEKLFTPENILLQNGNEIEVNEKEKLLVEGLACGTSEMPVSFNELLMSVFYGEISDGSLTLDEARSELGKLKNRVEKKLRVGDVKIVKSHLNVNHGVKGATGSHEQKKGYYLEAVMPEDATARKGKGKKNGVLTGIKNPQLEDLIGAEDTDIIAVIDGYLDDIDQKGIHKPLTGPEIRGRFRRLGTHWKTDLNDTQYAESKGYVTPLPGRDHHHTYDIGDITFLLLWHDRRRDNSFTPALVSKVHKLIEKRIAARNKEAGRTNGNH